MPKKLNRKIVEALKHEQASRKNIPSAEHEAVMAEDDRSPIEVAYERRNRDLDPQLVWRGKDVQDWSDLVVQAPPLFIQEKVHPKVLIDDLLRTGRRAKRDSSVTESGVQTDLFSDFNGLPSDDARTEFYQHDANWSNRMILGDSLQVMASLAEREGLRGKVQCIYLDPPYGIKFNSNFQWSTTSRDVKDGKADHITREPEQVKAFRDTWRDGIHSYLTYLRDRLTVARDLLTEAGSIFVQIGDENVHNVRSVMDEIFGSSHFVCSIPFVRTTGQTAKNLAIVNDYILFYTKSLSDLKFRRMFIEKEPIDTRWFRFDNGETTSRSNVEYTDDLEPYKPDNITAQSGGETTRFTVVYRGREFDRLTGGWKTNQLGMKRLIRACRIHHARNSIRYIRLLTDFAYREINNFWTDTKTGNFVEKKNYVVQTAQKIIQRCILMTTDPGDLVLDPTCGSGTTAYVAEQWGRRWITIDTSRVALALARTRVMSARFAYYLLVDSTGGKQKESEISGISPSGEPACDDVRQGFVYERVPHITLRSIANNTEIDVIWEKFQQVLEPLLKELNQAVCKRWREWEIPQLAHEDWTDAATQIHKSWWDQRVARQIEVDASIAANADLEFLYDKPYEDKSKVRVAGPFTVESISPHRVLGVDEEDKLIDGVAQSRLIYGERQDFARTILDQLRISGVQQIHKAGRLVFSSVKPWPGALVCAEGRYFEGNEESGAEKRAGVFLGPEFGTVVRPDLVAAAREAADAGFEVLVACAFNYDAHASEFRKLGKVPILKARMNAELHMAGALKNTGKGNLFVIFGEPDIDIIEVEERGLDSNQIQVKINGVDVFHPNTGQVRSDGVDGIACWFIDTDYNEESFFVRHAYFLGAGDPYKALKTTLKAEIDQEAWSTLYSEISRPFTKPRSGRFAVKVINHLGDEVMKVFRV